MLSTLNLLRFARVAVCFALGVFISASTVFGEISKETSKLFANRFGDFRAQEAVRPLSTLEGATPQDYGIIDGGTRLYATPDGARFVVEILRTDSVSAAFALLTRAAQQTTPQQNTAPTFSDLSDVGAYAALSSGQAAFVKDKFFVRVRVDKDVAPDADKINALVRAIASSIDGEAGGVPVLLQHLPQWETAQNNARYAVSLAGLQTALGNQESVLNGLNFAGGTEAVVANYETSDSSDKSFAQLALVEHLTPQLATDNNNRINALIAERQVNNQAVPTLFRRTGNYLVFVFGTTDETAKRLADMVKYEQDVRWLGDNPFAQERPGQSGTMMTLNAVLTSLKAAGLGVILCVAFGGIFGGLIFMRRRAQSAATDIYTDAGGMVRLNLDHLTNTPPNKLLKSGDEV